VYADFGCPACYVLSRRADDLIAAGVDVDWRAVEQNPSVAATGHRLSPAAHDALSAQFATLTGLLKPAETLPWVMPLVESNTEAAISAYGEAYGIGVGDDVRRLLFELYWQDRSDIGNPAVLRTPLSGPIMRGNSDADPLRESGYAVSVDRGPITTGAYRRIRAWRAEWRELGSPELPLVLAGDTSLTGLDAVRRFGTDISDAGVTVNAELPDARRYARVSGRPPAAWVSQIGGRWRRLYQGVGADR